ncbi:sulfite exporter TauE/SafE family protein [Shewanella nanhaiensis]|uniref:Probable membrane transporter protein n=1 Tax=Shewanella nanhaiensis TaxID=2864872 RepID=A0ABS7E5N6_9GAMM|nr:sulfite exporter TauE/SafE family protein [Shewanella nanhaiensis]MBW8184994.1 sulfite exporter TauE/SafE family protein [Shewanella nanhaiensis]
MELSLLLMTVFFAATLQAATGFGFGLIGVSFLIVLLQSNSAVQIVIILTLAMSLVHWIKIRKIAPMDLVKKIMLGCALGYPIGIIIFSNFDLTALKISVALLILAITTQNILEMVKVRKGHEAIPAKMGRGSCFGIGTMSGVMASAMAMPGPVVVAYLTRSPLTKDQIRATVITCSTFSYIVALGLQASFVGIENETLKTSLMLIPATFIGALFGDYIAKFINQNLFKKITLVVLFGSGVNILLNI